MTKNKEVLLQQISRTKTGQNEGHLSLYHMWNEIQSWFSKITCNFLLVTPFLVEYSLTSRSACTAPTSRRSLQARWRLVDPTVSPFIMRSNSPFYNCLKKTFSNHSARFFPLQNSIFYFYTITVHVQCIQTNLRELNILKNLKVQINN